MSSFYTKTFTTTVFTPPFWSKGQQQAWYLATALEVDATLPAFAVEYEDARYAVNQAEVSFDDVHAYSGANNGTYVDEDGVISLSGSNEPRFDFLTGVNGLLIEEYAQSDRENSDTANFSSSLGSITGGQDDPYGGTDAYLLDEGTATSYHAAYNNVSLTYTSGTTYAESFIVSPQGDNDRVQMLFSSAVSSTAYVNFYLNGEGAVTAEGTGATGYIKRIPNTEWYICTTVIDGNDGSGNAFAAFIEGASDSRLPSFTGTSRQLLIYGWNRTALPIPTSWIPSLTATTSRTADNVEITGTDFSDWYDATNNTISMAFNIPHAPVSGDYAFLFSINDGTSSNRIYAFVNSSGEITFKIIDGGTTLVTLTASDYTFGETSRIAASWDAVSATLSLDGGTEDAGLTGALPTVDQMVLGKSETDTFYMNGTVYDFYAWPVKASYLGQIFGNDFFLADLSPVLWLDAADETTITENGGSVSQWDDKSGNDYDPVQTTGANQPTTGSEFLNGKNVLQFSPEEKRLFNASGPIFSQSSSDEFTFIIVLKTPTSEDGYVLANASNASNGFGIYAKSDGKYYLSNGNDISGADSVSRSSNYEILTVRYSNNEVLMSINGSETTGTNTNSYTFGPAIATNPFAIGARPASTASLVLLDFNLAEICSYNRALSVTELNQVGQYLSSKWGVAWTDIA